MGRGEPTVHKIHETLGDIIKAAQQKAGITNEKLAAKVGVSERYIYRIENEGKKAQLRCTLQAYS